MAFVLRELTVEKLGLRLSTNTVFPVGPFGHNAYSFADLDEKSLDLVSREAARPFFFSIYAKFIDEFPWEATEIDFSGEETNALIEILQPLCKLRLGFDWSGTDIVRFPDSVLIYPMCNGEYVYMTDGERVLLDTFNAQDYLGKRFLTTYTSALKDFPIGFQGVTEQDNMLLCDDTMFNVLSAREIDRRMLSVDYHVWKTRSKGIVSNVFDSELDKWILAELCLVWNFNRTTTSNGQEFYSQAPQLTMELEVERKRADIAIASIVPVHNQLPTIASLPARAKRDKGSAAMHSKGDSKIIDRRRFKATERSLPYLLTHDEFRDFLSRAVLAVKTGSIPVIRIDGNNKTLTRDVLQNKINQSYKLLEKLNPWTKGLKGFVAADLSMYLPVFSHQDLAFLLTGDDYSYIKISSVLPGTVTKDNYVILSDNLAHSLEATDNIQSKWSNGELTSKWASYLLASKNLVSCVL